MSETAVEIEPFDYGAAGEREFAALNACGNRLRVESMPEDPPVDVDETMTNFRSIPPFVDVRLWAAWERRTGDGDRIVATGRITTADMPSNQHAAEFHVGVLPEFRRRGLGTQLLARVVHAAREQNRRLLITFSDSEIAGSEAFLASIGGKMGMSSRASELDLERAEETRLRSWIDRAPREEFELGMWEGSYPEEALPVVVALLKAINLAPRGELEIDDQEWTPELLRQNDAAMSERGVERWCLYARERSTGVIAGYTQLYRNPERPEILQQGDTAVFPEYRGRGLARWLKAAMLEKVRRDRPEVRKVRTDNAHSNAAMLKINDEMGFRPLKAWNVWQVEVTTAQEYLQRKGMAAA